MAVNLNIIQTREKLPELDNFIESNEKSTVFHSSKWMSNIPASVNFASYYCYEEDNNKIISYLPLIVREDEDGLQLWSGYSHLETIYGGFLFEESSINNKRKSIDNYLNNIFKYFKRVKGFYCELSPYSDINVYSNKFKSAIYYETPILEILQNPREIWSNLDYKSVKYPINKAKKYVNELKVNNLTDFKVFYEFLKETFKKSGNIPADYDLYLKIFDNYCNNIDGIFYSAHRDNIFLGGIVGIKYKHILCYLAGCSSEEGKKNYINDFLIWELIKWGNENNCTNFDLLRIPLNINNGIRNYKLKYSKNIVKLYLLKKKTNYGYYRSAICRIKKIIN